MPATEDTRVTIIPDDTNLPARVYSNFAIISSSPLDVTINFLDYTQPFDHEVADFEGEELYRETPVVARIAIRPGMVRGLITALETQLEIYEKKHQAKEVENKDKDGE